MTIQEFSDSFDTLLNSYNIQGQFGEGASKQSITLDEYEKSVLLTQAQDIIVKSYFDRNLNQQAQGFDDSERRQIDFSSLITKCTLSSWTVEYASTPDRYGTYFKVAYKGDGVQLRLYVGTVLPDDENFTEEEIQAWNSAPGEPGIPFIFRNFYPEFEGVELYVKAETSNITVSNWWKDHYDNFRSLLSNEGITIDVIGDTDMGNYSPYTNPMIDSTVTLGTPASGNDTYDDRGMSFKLPKDILVVLNERFIVDGTKVLVVKPLSYREYDREMSKAYAQPLKKQVWRIFNNESTGFDLLSEIIPHKSVSDAIRNSKSTAVYKIRYIKRPTPIVLTDLPDGLDIDGVNTATECSLNKILHWDILSKAVELALTTRGGASTTPKRRNREDAE